LGHHRTIFLPVFCLQRVPNTPHAVSITTCTAISLVTRNAPVSRKLKSLLRELNQGFQETDAEKVLKEEAYGQYRELVGVSKTIKMDDRRKLTEATVVTAEVVFKLREEREKADALKASRKAKKLGKALNLLTSHTTSSARLSKPSLKQKNKLHHTSPTQFPSMIPVPKKGDSD